MKRVLWLLLPVFLFSAPRMPLLEMFTNWGCPSCGPADDTLDNIYAQYQGQIAIIRYHTWWPYSNDPYYQENTHEDSARIMYYSTNYTPRLIINGTTDAQYFSDQWRGMIQNALQDTTPVVMSAQLLVDTSMGVLMIVVQAINNGTQTYDVMLRTVLIEDSLYAMGPNGHPWHHQVMRKMYPDAVGIHYTLAPGASIVDTLTGTLKTSWTPAHLRVVSFLQRNITREVYATTYAEATLTVVQEKPGNRLMVHRVRPDGVWLLLAAPPRTVEIFRTDGRRVSARLNPTGGGWLLSPRVSRRGVYFYRITLDDGRQLSGRLILF